MSKTLSMITLLNSNVLKMCYKMTRLNSNMSNTHHKMRHLKSNMPKTHHKMTLMTYYEVGDDTQKTTTDSNLHNYSANMG